MTPPGAESFIFLPFLLAMSQTERLYRTPAVILSRRDYGEADRVLTVFTPGLGKQEFLAKGIDAEDITYFNKSYQNLLTQENLQVCFILIDF